MFGLTWWSSVPNHRVNASPAVAPPRTPTAVNLKQREMTRRNRSAAPAPRAIAPPGEAPILLRSTPRWSATSCGEVELSRNLANPIHFPALATIRRERLLHARSVGRDVEPDVAHENGSSGYSDVENTMALKTPLIGNACGRDFFASTLALIEGQSQGSSQQRKLIAGGRAVGVFSGVGESS